MLTRYPTQLSCPIAMDLVQQYMVTAPQRYSGGTTAGQASGAPQAQGASTVDESGCRGSVRSFGHEHSELPITRFTSMEVHE